MPAHVASGSSSDDLLPVAEQTNNNQNKRPLMHREKVSWRPQAEAHDTVARPAPQYALPIASWAFNKRSAGTQVTDIFRRSPERWLSNPSLRRNSPRTKINPDTSVRTVPAARVSADTGVPSNAVICDNLQKYSSLNYQPSTPLFSSSPERFTRSISGAFLGIQIIQHTVEHLILRLNRESRHCTVRFQHSVIQSVFSCHLKLKTIKSQLWLKPVPDVWGVSISLDFVWLLSEIIARFHQSFGRQSQSSGSCHYLRSFFCNTITGITVKEVPRQIDLSAGHPGYRPR